MSKIPFTYKATSLAMRVLGRILKSTLHCDGTENLSDRPTLFVANHFTRMETFLLPYALYKLKGTMVHSLADHELFVGRFGEYLRTLGGFSSRDHLRDRIIIGELMKGSHNWVIFPEGMMVKNKKVYHEGKYRMDSPERTGPPHTGAAVLALKAEIYRRLYQEALEKGDERMVTYLNKRFFISGPEELAGKPVMIQPVNISYYPIRPGMNPISILAHSFIKYIPDRLMEELNVEGKLLTSKSDISIYFCAPIPVENYLTGVSPMLKLLEPFMSTGRRTSLTIIYQKLRLTMDFMKEVYNHVSINIDHLFAASLHNLKGEKLPLEQLKLAIFLSAVEVNRLVGRRIHPTLQEDLINLAADQPYEPFRDILRVAETEGLVQRSGDELVFQRGRFSSLLPFHRIRLNNIIEVINNELEPLRTEQKIIGRNINLPPQRLKLMVSDLLIGSERRRH
ncbi:MAG: 1-acyl-sn-glycerol-3-phosphate acyltransferase, partial [Planctomycetes bacterium]|nr:1-acyl-sn-glycerol-3-phosphate acyltransferase [Planctomycetota bacterium]